MLQRDLKWSQKHSVLLCTWGERHINCFIGFSSAYWDEFNDKWSLLFFLFDFLVLAVRGLGGCGDRRPAACQRWKALVCALCRGGRVLERPGGEGVCKVREWSRCWRLTPVKYIQEAGSCLAVWQMHCCCGCTWQVERLLWGSLWRLHIWGLWGLHRWSDGDVWAEKSST